MRPRFLLDEHLDPRLAQAAVRAGLDMTAVAGSEFAGRDDLAILGVAIAQGRILVTYDTRHFIPILRDVLRRGEVIPGLITVSTRTFRSNDLKGILRALIKLAARIERGEVDPTMGVTLTR
jgi:predicted nuclease of predicted toxin-antitoxin system